jgi:membrane protein insertase Oxa1/YidC/SpoIIIJ
MDFSHRKRRNRGETYQFISIHGNVTRGGQQRPISWLPEAVQNFSIWGGTGVALKTLHHGGVVPYWACFALMSASLRAALVPLVIHSAQVAARFAKVAPELQFIITLFQNDLKKMRAEGKSLFEQRQLFRQNLQTVRSIYKLHNINPLLVFVSPLLQIPFFYYVAVDLRKIVNGQDPELAQQLTESSFLYLTDLTDPDPWYGLPIAAGAMLYLNVEVAVGRRSLSGPTASKSDFAGLLKDLFQTLAVFMPCLASQSPAGLQVYLLSSFTWTLVQGAALRHDTVRVWIGLPSMNAPPAEAKYAQEFMEFKKLEQRARELRGDGPVLGRNVLAVGFETSFPGTNRPSTIQVSEPRSLAMMMGPDDDSSLSTMNKKPNMDMRKAMEAWGGHFIHGISAPMAELEARFEEQLREQRVHEIAEKKEQEQRQYLAQAAEERMVAANKGVILVPKDETKSPSMKTLDPARFKRKAKAGKKDGRKR